MANGEYDCYQNVRYIMSTAIHLVGLQNVSDRR